MSDGKKPPTSTGTYVLAALVLAGMAMMARARRRSGADGPPSAKDIHVEPEPMPSYGH